ncbi:MAG: hypothetical protein NWF05_00165 [Candidatus Bathyarchaeota archaeon]|nr:hypothetical protein [Candidatus Bathyarchaeota archaeon]
MQIPPLEYMDVALLLALGAIVFLITLELTSPYHGLTNLAINRKKLRNVTWVVGTLFLIIVLVRVISIVFNI